MHTIEFYYYTCGDIITESLSAWKFRKVIHYSSFVRKVKGLKIESSPILAQVTQWQYKEVKLGKQEQSVTAERKLPDEAKQQISDLPVLI
jgi:hypothetical protein